MFDKKRLYVSSFRLWTLWMLCAPLALAGCGPAGVPTYAVSGTVALDGKPVEQGDILFIPLDERMAPEGCQIVQGKYELRAKAGPNRIEITALDIGPNTVYIDGVPVAKNGIPTRYNTESTLERKVQPHNSNRFDFALSGS